MAALCLKRGYLTEINWNVAHVYSGTEREIRSAIEKTGRGAFVPTHVRGWFQGKHKRVREHPLMPGYVLFSLPVGDFGWGEFIYNIYGERRARVLGQVSDEDRVADLMIAHATGRHNAIQSRDKTGRFRRKRRRRPRPGKRLRDVRWTKKN